MRRKLLFLALLAALMPGPAAADAPSVFNAPKPPQSSNFSITAPAAGAVVDAGQNITVTVKPLNGYKPVSIFIAGAEIAVEVTPPEMSGTVTIPKNAGGVFKILVLAKDSAGKISGNELALQVTPSGPWRQPSP